MEKLLSHLRKAGQDPLILNDKAVILPFGARILGLYPKPGVNAFWINPSLATPGASDLLNESGWINLGGDRTWISPEIETHVKDPARMPESVEVPKAVDPGNYAVTEFSDSSATLESYMEVNFHRSLVSASLKVTKKISLLPAPDLPQGVTFAGYKMDVTLSAVAPLEGGIRPGLWNLIQVPGGGTIIVPIKQNASPRPFFGPTPYKTENGRVVCQVHTDTSFKFSIYAKDSRGISACTINGGPSSLLVVRRFDVLNPTRYADVPCDNPKDTGHVQQVYVDDGALGGFGEMEHHSAAIGPNSDTTIDHSETLAFAGPSKTLSQLLEVLIAEKS